MFLALDTKFQQLADYVRDVVTQRYGQKNERFQSPDSSSSFLGLTSELAHHRNPPHQPQRLKSRQTEEAWSRSQSVARFFTESADCCTAAGRYYAALPLLQHYSCA